MKVHIIFTNNSGLTSKIHRTVTGTRWSHIDVMINNIECVGPRRNKVVKHDVSDLLIAAKEFEIHEVSSSNYKEVIKFVKNQLGKEYDSIKLVVDAFKAAQTPLFDDESEVSLKDLYTSPKLNKLETH